MIDALNARVQSGLLSCRQTGPLVIYNYTPRCVYDDAWDDVTLQARGLVFEAETGLLVARPWGKFFNHNEPRGVVPARKPDEVTVKLDGSLGIGFNYGGRVEWATRGSLESPQAAAARMLWERDHASVEIPDGITLLAEIIHESSRVVVHYDFDGLVVLGMRETATGADLPHKVVQNWCATHGIRCVPRLDSMLAAEFVAAAGKLDADEEGFVLRWGDHRVKVKGAAYLEVHRLISGITERVAADWWYSRQPLHPLLPEETRAYIESVGADLDAEVADLEAETTIRWSRLSGITDRGDFARTAGPRTREFQGLIARFTGKSHDARRQVYRERFNGHPRPVGGGE